MSHFLPFYPPNSSKNQNLKKWKKSLEISSFYTSVPKIMIICYTVPEIWCMTDGFFFFFSFWVFFSPFTLTARRYHLSPGDIITLHTCSKNYDQMIYSSWYIVHNGWTYGQTDRRKKWHIEVGVPPKKFISTNAYSILFKKSFQSSCILMRFPKNSF